MQTNSICLFTVFWPIVSFNKMQFSTYEVKLYSLHENKCLSPHWALSYTLKTSILTVDCRSSHAPLDLTMCLMNAIKGLLHSHLAYRRHQSHRERRLHVELIGLLGGSPYPPYLSTFSQVLKENGWFQEFLAPKTSVSLGMFMQPCSYSYLPPLPLSDVISWLRSFASNGGSSLLACTPTQCAQQSILCFSVLCCLR